MGMLSWIDPLKKCIGREAGNAHAVRPISSANAGEQASDEFSLDKDSRPTHTLNAR
jgi:hypothetical protein